jgi:molecular chaperone GrpE
MSKTTPDDGAEADQDNEIQSQDQPELAETEELVDGGDPQTSEKSGSPEGLDLEQVLEKLAAAELAAEHAKDDLLRVQAEMQNLRRRTEQDIEKAHKYGQEKFSIELLSVMDNLERALTAASEHEDDSVKAIYDGVDLTLKSFIDCFSKFNIETLDPLGEPFDPQTHQAMSMQENPEVEPNTVIAVMQKGYTLHGRVIRPAMVMVAKEPSLKVNEEE